MEPKKYKMIYTTKKDKKLEIKIKYFNEPNRKKIKSDDIRIIGHKFFQYNKNKAKLIINNKKSKLKEFINCNEFNGDNIKIYIIPSKKLLDISHMFENCAKLIEFSFIDEKLNIINKKLKENENDNKNNYSKKILLMMIIKQVQFLKLFQKITKMMIIMETKIFQI